MSLNHCWLNQEGRQNMKADHTGIDSTTPAPPTEVAELVRLSINLTPTVNAVLKSYASRKGVSVTEAVRRAISILSYIDEAQTRGETINVDDGDRIKEVQFLC